MFRLPLQFKRDGIIYWPFGQYNTGSHDLHLRSNCTELNCSKLTSETLLYDIVRAFYVKTPDREYFDAFCRNTKIDFGSFSFYGVGKDNVDEKLREAILYDMKHLINRYVTFTIDDDFFYTLKLNDLTLTRSFFVPSRAEIATEAERMIEFYATKPR